MKRRNLLLILLLSVTVASCIYPYEATFEGAEPRLVIEADILAGGTTVVKLSQISLFSDIGKDISTELGSFDVRLEVEGGETISGSPYVPWYVSGTLTGQYRFDCSAIRAGDRCRIKVHDDERNRDYESDWVKVLEPPVIDNLDYVKNEVDGNLELRVSFHNIDDSRYYLISSEELWEYHSQAKAYWIYHHDGDSIEYSPEPVNYYCWRYDGTTVSETLDLSASTEARSDNFVYRRIPRGDERLQVMYRSVIYLATIPKESYEYWANLDRISSAGGDLFTPIPSERPGNIHSVTDRNEQVLGLVTASTVAIDTLYYDNDKEFFYRYEGGTVNIEENLPRSWAKDLKLMKELGLDRIWTIYQPFIEEPSDFNPYGKTWMEKYPRWSLVEKRCVDCRLNGGSRRKPDGWPNDHPGISGSVIYPPYI